MSTLAYDARIARFGAGGKWHIVRSYASTEAHTACGITLRDRTRPSAYTVIIEHKNGEPTCAHCLRWWGKQKVWC